MATTSTDPIADMLTRIRNAVLVRKNEIQLPYSNMKERIANLLKDHHLIESVEVIDPKEGFKSLKLVINEPQTNAKISAIERMSSPDAGFIPAPIKCQP